MLRKTHISMGITTALIMLRPATVPGCLCALLGGAVGGWLPDIDLNTNKANQSSDEEDLERYIYYDETIDNYRTHDAPGWIHSNYQAQTRILMFILVLITLGIDYYFGGGACDYCINHHGPFTYGAAVTFILICIFGYFKTAHHTFMHSILVGAILSFLVYVICQPLALPFAFGFGSHILLDGLNKKPGVAYLWPIKKGFRLGLVSADGKANGILGSIGVITTIFFLSIFLIPSLLNSEQFQHLISLSNIVVFQVGPVMVSILGIYLLGINLLTFIVLFLLQLRYYYSIDIEYSDQDHDFFIKLVDILVFAGGAIGMLLFAFWVTGGKIDKSQTYHNNTNLFLIPFCMIVILIATFISVRYPGFVSMCKSFLYNNTQLPVTRIVLGYFAFINIFAFALYYRDFTTTKVFSKAEFGMLFLAFIGGAAGAYLALGFTGMKRSVQHFMFGLPLMMAMHDFLLAPIIISLI